MPLTRQYLSRNFRCFAGIAAIVLAVAGGCGSNESDTTEDAPGIPSAEQAETAVTMFDIGDVDANMHLVLELSEKSESDSIAVERSEGLSGELRLLNLDVAPPHPEELLLTLTMDCRRDFTDHAVVVNVRILRDEIEIESYSFVTGRNASTEDHAHEVNVLKGLDSAPETMLVRAETWATVFMNTDEDTITADTEPAADAKKTAIRSNPVRINFKSDG